MKDYKNFFNGWDFCAGMTTPVNKSNITQACNKIYSYIGLTFPNIVFVDSPIKACAVYYKLKKSFSVSSQIISLINNAYNELYKDLNKTIINTIWENNLHYHQHISNFTPSSIAFDIPYLFGNQDKKVMYLDFLLKNKYTDKSEINLIKSKLRIDGFFEMQGCHWWIPMDSVVICVDRPISISYNKFGYHCDKELEPAIIYRDNVKVYAKNGKVSKIEYGYSKTKTRQYKIKLSFPIDLWRSKAKNLHFIASDIVELFIDENVHKLTISSSDIIRFIKTTKSYQVACNRIKTRDSYKAKMNIPLKINVSWHNGIPKVESIEYEACKKPVFLNGLLTNSNWLL